MRRNSFLLIAGLSVAMLGLLHGNNVATGITPATVSSTAVDSLAKYADGQTDCTDLLQQLIDAGTGGIHFPPGKYRISRPLDVDLAKVGYTALTANGNAQIIMTGPGPATRFRGTHTGTAAPHTVKPEIWDRERTPTVEGLEILGAHPDACGIEATGTMQLTITRVVVRKTLHAVHLTGRNRNVLLGECHLYENRGIGVFLDHLNLHQINIANCHISYNEQGGIVSRNSEIRNLQIGTCDIEGNMGDADAPPAANIELDAKDSSLGEVTVVGCTIQHGHLARDSANIRIDGLSNAVKFTDERRHSNITIADNVMSDVQLNLDIRNVRGLTLTGNTIWQGYAWNAVFENCSNIVIANNVFERNPRYHYGDAADARLGILLENCSDATLTGNLISGAALHPASLTLRHCSRINLSGCSILDYGELGLDLEDVHDSLITGCIIHRAESAAEPIAEPSGVRAQGKNIRMFANLLNEAETP